LDFRGLHVKIYPISVTFAYLLLGFGEKNTTTNGERRPTFAISNLGPQPNEATLIKRDEASRRWAVTSSSNFGCLTSGTLYYDYADGN
jgi:hypothetical protein